MDSDTSRVWRGGCPGPLAVDGRVLHRQWLMSAEPGAFLSIRTPRRRRCANPPPRPRVNHPPSGGVSSCIRSIAAERLRGPGTGLGGGRSVLLDQPPAASPSLPRAQQTGSFPTTSRPCGILHLPAIPIRPPAAAKLQKRIPGAPFFFHLVLAPFFVFFLKMLFNGGKVSMKKTENEAQEGCLMCSDVLTCQRLFLSKPSSWETGLPLPSASGGRRWVRRASIWPHGTR